MSDDETGSIDPNRYKLHLNTERPKSTMDDSGSIPSSADYMVGKMAPWHFKPYQYPTLNSTGKVLTADQVKAMYPDGYEPPERDGAGLAPQGKPFYHEVAYLPYPAKHKFRRYNIAAPYLVTRDDAERDAENRAILSAELAEKPAREAFQAKAMQINEPQKAVIRHAQHNKIMMIKD